MNRYLLTGMLDLNHGEVANRTKMALGLTFDTQDEWLALSKEEKIGLMFLHVRSRGFDTIHDMEIAA